MTHRLLVLLAACSLLVSTACEEKPTSESQPVAAKPAKAEAEGGELAAEPPEEPEPEPKPAVEAPPSDVPDSIEGANLSVADLEADGLKAEKLSCKLEGGGGLLAGPITIGALAKQKVGLDACVKEPTKARVAWTSADTLTNIRVADTKSPEEAACIAKALGEVRVPGKGECAATLVLGQK